MILLASTLNINLRLSQLISTWGSQNYYIHHPTKAMLPVLFTQKVKHTKIFTLPLLITLKILWGITQSCRGNWKMQKQQSYICKAHEFHVHMHQNWEMQFLSAEESSDLPHHLPHQVLRKFFINSLGVPPFTNVTSCLRLFCSSIEK